MFAGGFFFAIPIFDLLICSFLNIWIHYIQYHKVDPRLYAKTINKPEKRMRNQFKRLLLLLPAYLLVVVASFCVFAYIMVKVDKISGLIYLAVSQGLLFVLGVGLLVAANIYIQLKVRVFTRFTPHITYNTHYTHTAHHIT